jgi:diguanylate cyclase (GGDEF)-like protein
MIQIGGFGTRVTRRMVGLFIACALLPVGAALFAGYDRVHGALVEQRLTLLRDAAGGYGVALVDRLNAADAIAHSGAIEASREASGYFRAGVVLEPGGGRTLLFGEADRMPGRRELADLDRRLASGASGLAVVRLGDGSVALWLVRDRARRRVALELDLKYLWAVEDLPYLMDLCVLGPDGVPMTCTRPLPDEALAALRGRSSTQPHGDVAWSAEGTRYLSGFHEVFLRGRFGAGTWTIVASQPERHALAPVKAVGRLVIPVLLVALLGAALIGVVLVRRTLAPLQPLTAAARRLGAGDFTARVAEARDDEFGALGSAFNAMSARLGRQFNSLVAHAEIDTEILSGVDLPRIAAIVLRRMAELAPADRHYLVLADPVGPGYTLYSTAGARPLELPGSEILRLLAAPDGATALPGIVGARASGLPIALERRYVGAMVLAYDQVRQPTAEEVPLLRDLADRVAVALTAARRERELERRANYDPLTQLPNRALGLEELTRAVAAAERSGRSLAVLFVDLDGFADVNDSAGHAVGDQVLAQAAARLRSCLRKSDLVARLGGDEFAVVLPEVRDAVDAAQAAHHVIEALSTPFQVGARVLVTAGVGIALYPADGASAEELLRHADLAMVHAKSAGRSQVAFFAPAMNAEIRRRVELERELHLALDDNQFILHYQPQLDLRLGRIVGAEALVRWLHPLRGLMPPAQFIGFAESSGLIEDLGRWTLRAAVAQFVTWRAQGLELGYVAVNVSPRQFRNPAFTEMVASALREYMMPAAALRLEITESAVMNNDAARANLAGLTALGTPLELDDFGTGYSSLAQLQRLPIVGIKIDRAFVRDIELERGSQAVVRAAIEMAHALGKTVVGEGVEHAGQLEMLRSMGCDVVQGYFLSPPVTAVKFADLLRSRPLPARTEY